MRYLASACCVSEERDPQILTPLYICHFLSELPPGPINLLG